MRSRIVAFLLRLYPGSWVKEYGPELADMLLARPLTARVAGDVVWNAFWQRIRATDVATRAGFAMLLVSVAAFAANVAAPAPYEPQSNAPVPVLSEVAQIVQQPLNSELYVLMLVALSCWITLRGGGSLPRSGRAAMKASFIAGIPMMVAGALILLGVLNIAVVAPGDVPTTFREHGFTLTYYDTRNDLPAPYVLLFSPLFRLPGSFLWGVIGGLIGRGLANSRRRAVT
jgi:hypothetical protein